MIHFVSVRGIIAQEDYNSLKVGIVCSKREIIAGENLGLQITISNISNKAVCIAPPQPVLYLNLIVQSGGTNIPPQVKRSLQSFGNIEIAANGKIIIDEELCTWFPLGLYAGEFILSASYIPNKDARRFTIRSDTVHITVVPRSSEQEVEYKDFVGIISSSGNEAIRKGALFLTTHSNSMFEPRVKLELAGRYLTVGDYGSANKMLEGVSILPSATTTEKGRKHYLSARVMKAQGCLSEAIIEAEKCPSLWVANEVQVWKTELKKKQSRDKVGDEH